MDSYQIEANLDISTFDELSTMLLLKMDVLYHDSTLEKTSYENSSFFQGMITDIGSNYCEEKYCLFYFFSLINFCR
jgi:hypothetical protein